MLEEKKKRIIIELQKYKHECTYQNNIPIEKWNGVQLTGFNLKRARPLTGRNRWHVNLSLSLFFPPSPPSSDGLIISDSRGVNITVRIITEMLIGAYFNVEQMSKCIAGRAPKRGRQGYSICAWRGGGSEGRGERIDYTPRITLGPFSIIFRWNINRAVNNNPLYRGVRTHTHTHTEEGISVRTDIRVHTTQMAVVSGWRDQKIFAWTAVRAKCIRGWNWKYTGVFRAINIRTGRRSINYDSCFQRSTRRRWRCMTPCGGSVAARFLWWKVVERCLSLTSRYLRPNLVAVCRETCFDKYHTIVLKLWFSVYNIFGNKISFLIY